MSGCCCIDVDSPMTFGSETIRIARKDHQCGECPDTIHKGDRYEYVSGMWEDYFDSHKTCWTCFCVRRDFFECGGYFGRVREDFRECYGWDYYDGPDADDEAEAADPLFLRTVFGGGR